MEYMHEGDDQAQEQVHTSTERYEKLSAEIGTSAVKKLDFGSVVAAATAWRHDGPPHSPPHPAFPPQLDAPVGLQRKWAKVPWTT